MSNPSSDMTDLVDTHCHIQSIGQTGGERTTRELWAESDLSADQVIDDSIQAGVNRLVCVGCDLTDSRLAVDFVADRKTCWASIGIHPHEAKHHLSGEKLAEFAALADRPKVIAVGECGLDYYYEHSPRADQIKALEFQLELAETTGLPLIFHVRDAFEDFWPVLDNYGSVKGVLHSFTDSAANLAEGLDRGFHIGVNGIATFAKDAALLTVYESIPLDRLLLETDAPFLTPSPHRGSINEPKRVADVAAFLADLRGESFEDVARATTANARQLFSI
jgi:TatD DNase family protein